MSTDPDGRALASGIQRRFGGRRFRTDADATIRYQGSERLVALEEQRLGHGKIEHLLRDLAEDKLPVRSTRNHACALRNSGELTCWGAGLQGQLGDDTNADRATPVEVHGIANVVAISAGDHSSCAISAGRQLHCWGALKGLAPRSTPMVVPGLSSVVSASVNQDGICAI